MDYFIMDYFVIMYAVERYRFQQLFKTTRVT